MSPLSPRFVPRVCVWELTLACDCKCIHCGSSGGKARPKELDTSEALRVVQELAALGCESVTFSGGEALLRPDWPTLAAAVRLAGMRLELITNGLGVAVQADALREAGFFGITFSVDGPEAIHDELRGIPGGLEQLLRGADALRERRVRIGAVTQLNRRSFPHLDQTAELLAAHGFEGWQWQLTMPQGRARERADALCLAPEQLPELERRFLELRSRVPFFVHLADNIGYMSRCEPKLRTQGDGPTRIWTGCAAGVSVVGVTSDGTVRGCLSLPREADEGSLRDRSLSEIWNDPGAFAYNRRFKPEQLSGPCAGCPFGPICRGGCRSLAWSRGSPHSNAYCSGRVGREREREAHQS